MKILPLGKLQRAGLRPEPAPRDRCGKGLDLQMEVPVSVHHSMGVTYGPSGLWTWAKSLSLPRPRPTEGGAPGHGGSPPGVQGPFLGSCSFGRTPHSPALGLTLAGGIKERSPSLLPRLIGPTVSHQGFSRCKSSNYGLPGPGKRPRAKLSSGGESGQLWAGVLPQPRCPEDTQSSLSLSLNLPGFLGT